MGLAVAVVAPVLQLCGVVGPVLHTPWLSAVGVVVATVGVAAMVYAQFDMGDSWRIGVDDTETTALVRTGVFARVRNPIYTAMLTFGLGITLVTPNLVAIGALILLVVIMEVQVRRVEEPYLLRKHGNSYRDYRATVGRFVPGVGLVR